jgi:TP901 family phage tail tape measure protein
MPGTYWLTILPDTKNLKPGIQAALAGQEFKPKFTVDKDAAKKAGRDAAKIAEDEANKSQPKIKPTADKAAAKKAGDDAAEESRKPVENKRPKVKPQPDLPGSRKAGEDAGAAVGGGLMSSLKMLGPLLGGATLFGGLKASLTEGMDFTSALNTMSGVTRATGEQLKAVGDIARQLGSDVSLPGVSATTAAQAMTELAKGGFSVQQSMDAARGTLQLAGAAGIDAASAATIQADALHAFGLSAKDAGYAADVLANVANASTGEITDFAAGFQQAGAVASQFGMSIDDTAAALGTLANQGIKGSDAGTLVKSALLAITDQGNPAQGAIKELGLTLYDATGRFVGMRSMMDQLGTAAKSMSPELYQAATNTLFGSDAARLAGVAAKEGATGFDILKEAVNKQGGAADMAAAKTKGLPGAWANFKNTLDNVKLSIYDMIQGPLTGLLGGLTKVPDFVTRNSTAFKVLGGIIMTVAIPALTLWAAAQAKALATSAISGLVSMVGAWGRMASVLRLSTVAQYALNVAMSANPIGIVIVGLAALTAGLVWFFTKTETGRKIWSTVWAAIKTAASAVFDWLKSALETVGEKLSWLWDKGKAAFDGIKGAIEVMWNGVKVVWDKFTGILDTVGNKVGAFKDTLANAFNAVKDVVSAVWDKIGGILDRIGDGIGRIKDAGGAVLNAIGLGGNASGGIVNGPGYAGGGRIFGPGNGTSDSILGYPAMVGVSNGEYVVNAVSTAANLPLLQAINSGAIKGYAGGGQVQLGNISGPGITTNEQQSMWNAIRMAFPDAVLTSATRTVMTEGHPDFHNAGRAIDISGPSMGAIASWIASNYPDSLELIHSPFGSNIKNGKNVGNGNTVYGSDLMDAHGNHVHWALGKTANARAGKTAESDSGSYSSSSSIGSASSASSSSSSSGGGSSSGSSSSFSSGGGGGSAGGKAADKPADAGKQFGQMFVGGLLETVGLNGDLFSNPLEWPSVKSIMAGVNYAGGLLSMVGAKPGGAATVSDASVGVGGGFAAGAAESVGLGGLLSAILRPSDFTSGSPRLAPGEFNPGVVGGNSAAASGSAMAPAAHGGTGAAPGAAVDNSININGNVGMDPGALQTKMRSEQNARTRTTVMR